MSNRRLIVTFVTSLSGAFVVAAGAALGQAAPSAADSILERGARDAVATDSAALSALRDDPNTSGQDYNKAVMTYRAARSLLRSGDYGGAADSAGAAQAAADAAAGGGRDLFDRQSNGVGAAPLGDSTVSNTQRAVPDGVPQRTFRDSLPFGVGSYSPDAVPQRTFRDSLPFGTDKAQPVNQP
jgi:hypothetical protein